ncbi:MAG: circularly permuted type 2 ATP-grasp protein, partial [Trebonia sp.]
MIITGREAVADILQESGAEADRALPAGDVPPAVTGPEWDRVSRGVRQRVLALEAFLADAYGRGRAFDDGVVPWRLLFTSGEFRREVAGLIPPNGVRLHAASFDLVRDERGQFRILTDNVSAPSGVSHVTGEYAARLLSALRAAAPHGVTDPRVVLLTAGAHD